MAENMAVNARGFDIMEFFIDGLSEIENVLIHNLAGLDLIP